MLTLVGTTLLLLAALLVALSFTHAIVDRKLGFNLAKVLLLIAPMVALAGITFVIGPVVKTASVSVIGGSEDLDRYQQIIKAAGSHYRFNVLDTQAPGAGAQQAVSCNREELERFVDRLKAHGVVVAMVDQAECVRGGTLSNFLHPHIAVYLH